MRLGRGARVALVVVATLLLQNAALSGLRVDGIRPDLLLGVAALAGVAGGPEGGAVLGFFAGLAADVFVPTPFGLSALTWCVVAYSVGILQAMLLPSGRGAVPLTTLAASSGGVVLFGLLATVLGQPGLATPHLIVVAVVVGALNALASPVLIRGVRWAFAPAAPARTYTPLSSP